MVVIMQCKECNNLDIYGIIISDKIYKKIYIWYIYYFAKVWFSKMIMNLFCKTLFTIINWRWHGKSRFATMAKCLKKFLNLTGVYLVMGYGYPKFVFFESENSYGEIGFFKFILKNYCWFSDTRPVITSYRVRK